MKRTGARGASGFTSDMFGAKTRTERKKSGAASSYQDLPADWYEAGKAERPLSQDERDHMIIIGLAVLQRKKALL